MKRRCVHRALWILTAMAVTLPACSSAEPAQVEIRRAELAPGPGLIALVSRSGETVYVHDAVELSDPDFLEASLAADNLGRPAVLLTLTDPAAARLQTLTRAHLEKPFAILVRGELVAAPIVKSPLSRAVMITGLSDEEASGLVEALGAGS